MTSTALAERGWADSPRPDVSFIDGKGPLSPVPAFPLDLLGKFWSSYICDHAGEDLPRDYFAMSLLGTVAGLIGNSREAAMPSPSTFTQPATLWAINVGLPSSGKTPAIKPFIRIVDALESQTGEPIKVEDSTIAGTIDALVENANGIMVMNDELSGWWETFKQDRQGEAFWLKSWNGDLPYTHRRKKVAFVVPRANISVVGGTQPATLSTMVEATGKIEKGFVSRCMFSFPDEPKGQVGTGKRPNDAKAAQLLSGIYFQHSGATITLPVTPQAAAHHKAWWEALKARLYPDPTMPEGQWLLKQRGNGIRLALLLEVLWHASGTTADAKTMKRVQHLAASADPKRNTNAPERKVARIKLVELCEQFSLDPKTLKPMVGTHPQGGPALVSLRAMKGATDLIEGYFYPHFMRCESFAYQPVNQMAAIKLCEMLIKQDLTEFNARELRQYNYGKVHASLHGNSATATVNEVCEYLIDRHILRESGASTAKGGRKSSNYEVHPLLQVLGARALARR